MLALWICARLVHDATSGLSLPWCGAGHPTPIVPSRGYERDCHAVGTGPAMLSSESAPILRHGRHGFPRCARCCLGSGPTDAAVAFAISRSGMTARRRRLGPTSPARE
jgi:hypothetical protein